MSVKGMTVHKSAVRKGLNAMMTQRNFHLWWRGNQAVVAFHSYHGPLVEFTVPGLDGFSNGS